MALAKEYQQQLLNYPLSAAALASFEAEAQAQSRVSCRWKPLIV